MLFIWAILFWLLLNYIFWWFWFNTFLCIFAWLFVIMPVLLKIKFKDIKKILWNKKLIFLNILINFIIYPLLAFILWYFIFWLDNYYYIFSIILLAMIPWWGLLVNWLHHSWADMKVWFTLLALNLFLFSIFFIPFNLWLDYFVNYQIQKKQQSKNIKVFWNNSFLWDNFSKFINLPKQNKIEKPSGCAIQEMTKKIWLNSVLPWCFQEKWSSTLIYGFYWFVVLIFIPFLLSRIILLSTKLSDYLKKYVNVISKLASFLIIVYIFSLNYIRWIFKIDIFLLWKIILWVLLLYLFMFIIEKLILKYSNFENNIKQAIFWNWFVRFITLWFILSFLYAIAWNKPEIVVIFIIAYFIQILLSSIFIKFNK